MPAPSAWPSTSNVACRRWTGRSSRRSAVFSTADRCWPRRRCSACSSRTRRTSLATRVVTCGSLGARFAGRSQRGHHQPLRGTGRSGPEHPYLPDDLKARLRHFGSAPTLLASEGLVLGRENERLVNKAGVKQLLLSESGRATQEREGHEIQRWFRRGFPFGMGLRRCLDRGEAEMKR